ncbi:MAG: alpha/beta fold hydrolase [Clostridia bacterium]|nr:alpha/beta fold hydrolase [Clostridia bacterium]
MSYIKRIGIVVLCAVLCAAAVPAAGEKAEGKKRIDTPEEAELFVCTLLGEDPAALDGEYLLSARMEQAITENGGFRVLAQQLAALGKAGEISPAYEGKTAGMKSFRVPCRFALAERDIVLIPDDEGAIDGLVIDLYTGPEQAESAETKNYTELQLALPVEELNGELPGTLTIPEGEGPFPAVVLVHGSGPSDRDESIGMLKPFRDIAEDLAGKGIAVYRFEKRTLVYGGIMAADRSATLMDESVVDAARAVQMLAGQEKIDPERIFVLGHSLGGTAIPAIDLELKSKPVHARGYILMAPGARRLDEIIRDQYDFLAALMPEAESEREAVFADLDRLENPDALKEEDVIAGAYAEYWKWLIGYDAVSLAADIDVPCLLLQGEEDYQVTMEDYQLFRNATEGMDNWIFKSYPGLVHTFTEGKKAEGPAAYTRNGHVSGNVTADIAEFILNK